MNGLQSPKTDLKARTPRDRSTQPKEMFRKSNTADQLLEVLPVRFKKSVRQLVEEYESERVELLRLLKQSPSSDLQVYSYKKKLEQLVEENSWLGKETAAWQERARLLQFQLEEAQRKWQEKELEVEHLISQANSLNMTIELTQEQSLHSESLLMHRLARLQRQLEQQHTALSKKNEVCKLFSQSSLAQSAEASSLRSRLQELEQQRKAAEQRAESIEKQLRKKKIVEIRDTLSRQKEQEPRMDTLAAPAPSQLMKSSCFRKLSEALSPNYRAVSTRSSIGESIKRAKEMLSSKNEKKEDSSDHDSLEFGKEKVIEKKKVRKLLTDLLSSAPAERKLMLERLSLEIGLKEPDTERFLELF